MSKSDSELPSESCIKGCFADRTHQVGIGLREVFQDQDDFSPAVKARLANVVRDLRAAWLAGPALLWEDIHHIYPVSRTGLDKRVSSTLRDSFLGFSQFIAGLEQLLLDTKQMGTEKRESFLRLQKLIVHLNNCGFQNGIVSSSNSTAADSLGGTDSTEGSGKS